MRALEKLIAYPEWKVYQTLVREIARPHHQKLIQQVVDIGGIFANEYAKGAVYGLTAALDIPSVTITQVRTTILHTPEGEDDE